MGVMSLGIPTNSEITISCNGDDEDAASRCDRRSITRSENYWVIE